jgi:hypothetical protein
VVANPYAGTPLWAKWNSIQMGWPVTPGVENAADGPVRCDRCGATETFDHAILATPIEHELERPGALVWRTFTTLNWHEGWRLLTLEDDYCLGCGFIICQKCEDEVPFLGDHEQSRHLGIVA